MRSALAERARSLPDGFLRPFRRAWAGPCILWLGAALTSGCPAGSGDGPRPGDGSDGQDAGAVVPAGRPPNLLDAQARMSGRFGHDLTLEVSGTDPDADAVALAFRVLDSMGLPMGEEQVRAFDAPVLGLPEFSARVTLERLLASPGDAAQVEVSLVDATGLRSDVHTKAIDPQPVLGFGEPCDPGYVENRCEPGLGCRGEPASCLEGVAPTITRASYLRGRDDVRILVEGDEPDDDFDFVRIDFFNRNDEPVDVDLDGDGISDASSFAAVATEAGAGRFFVALYPSHGFDDQVPRLQLTPVDASGKEGGGVTVDIDDIDLRDWNQSCDPRGFDVCVPLATCTPGLVGVANRCGAPNAARQAQCSEATVIELADTAAQYFGEARGASLWEPPEDCVSPEARARPEGIVVLELSRGEPTLVIDAAQPGTTFDTVLYVLEGICPASGMDAAVLACSDDVPGGLASRVELTNVPPGEYLVVVDSWDPGGGRFQLSVGRD